MAFFVPIIFGNKRMLQPLKSNDSLCLDVQLETNGKNRQVDITNQFIPNQVSPPKVFRIWINEYNVPPRCSFNGSEWERKLAADQIKFYMPLK